MLLQACREGDLDVVLRLVYTNPFLDKQELRDALWESVRCRRLEVLRSLIEFQVDPASVPSPGLSQPPRVLSGAPWTPLVALAVNGSAERAQIVAELLSRSDRKRATSSTGLSVARKISGSMEDASVSLGETQSKEGTMRMPVQHISVPERESVKAKIGCPAQRCPQKHEHNDAVTRPATWPQELQPLTVLTESNGPEALEVRLQALQRDSLQQLESALESVLRMVRSHRQQRLEQELQSVQRRHTEESKGRQTLEDELSCVVCSEQEKTVLLMPCRHLCTCQSCAEQLTTCPICRARIDRKVECLRP